MAKRAVMDAKDAQALSSFLQQLTEISQEHGVFIIHYEGVQISLPSGFVMRLTTRLCPRTSETDVDALEYVVDVDGS